MHGISLSISRSFYSNSLHRCCCHQILEARIIGWSDWCPGRHSLTQGRFSSTWKRLFDASEEEIFSRQVWNWKSKHNLFKLTQLDFQLYEEINSDLTIGDKSEWLCRTKSVLLVVPIPFIVNTGAPGMVYLGSKSLKELYKLDLIKGSKTPLKHILNLLHRR